MKTVFGGSFLYLVIVNSDEAAHERSLRAAELIDGPAETTAWVLTEVAGGVHAAVEVGGLPEGRWKQNAFSDLSRFSSWVRGLL